MVFKKLSALTKNQIVLIPVIQKGFIMAWGRWETLCLDFKRWDTYTELKASSREGGILSKWWLFPFSLYPLLPPRSPHRFTSSALMLPPQLHVGTVPSRQHAQAQVDWGLTLLPQLRSSAPVSASGVGGAQEVNSIWLLLPQKPCLLTLGQWRGWLSFSF